MTRQRTFFGLKPFSKRSPDVICLPDESAHARDRQEAETRAEGLGTPPQTSSVKTARAKGFTAPAPIVLGASPLAHKPSAQRRAPITQTAPTTKATTSQASTKQARAATPVKKTWSPKKRLAVLLGIIAVPAMAAGAPEDFGQLPAGAPTEAEMVRQQLQEQLAQNPAMPFERPGMSFPGSAFFFLADPPSDALIALPTTDALAEDIGEAGREVGALIEAGPGATPFFSVGGTSHMRASECLAQAIWYEAASESEAGQRAVAQVVLNRVAHPSWPGSVCGVVYQGSSRRTGCQFTFTCDGSLRRRAAGRSWERAQNIASEALSGSVYEPIGHATHYHTLWVNPYWASSLDHVGTIGAHRFYRNRGSAGKKGAFTQNYAGAEPGVRDRVTAPPRVEAVSANADYAPRAGTPARSAPPSSRATYVAPAQSGPGVVLADEALNGAGQVRQDYSRAGQWKSDAARAALIADEQQQASESAAQSARKSPLPR